MRNEAQVRRIWLAAAVVVIAAVLGILAFSSIGESLVYYWSPSELRASGHKAIGATIRLGGLVQPGSVVHGSDGLSLDFVVTDGKNSVPVHAEAVPPAMFREGIGVVVEGTMLADGRFETRRLMVKHDNEYRAPTDGEDVDMKELMKSMQFDDNP
jgi:cytochrome c-type biogenesis protein CcmE